MIERAKIVVRNLPTMSYNERRALAAWMRRKAREMEGSNESAKIFNKLYRARYF